MWAGDLATNFRPVILTHTWGWEPLLVPPSALGQRFSSLLKELEGELREVKGRANERVKGGKAKGLGKF